MSSPNVVMNEKTKYQLNDLLRTACCKNKEMFVLDSVLQKFKSIVKQGDAYVETAYHQLMKSILPMKNSSTRYLSLLFIHECMRSKTFRALLAQDFKLFIELTIAGSPTCSKTDKSTVKSCNGSDPSSLLPRKNSKYNNSSLPNLLPPPEKSAVLLRKKALEYVEQWSEVYGDIYPAFTKGHDYIDKVLKFQFPRMREHHLDQAFMESERKKQTQIILQKKFKNIREGDFEEKCLHIEVCMRQLDACLDQIVPTFEDMMKDALREEEVTPNVNVMDNNTNSNEENQQENVTTSDNIESDENVNITESETIIEEDDEWEEVMVAEPSSPERPPLDIDDMMTEIGIFSNDYEIVIDLKDIFKDTETIDNVTLFEICKENLNSLKNIYQPQLKEWMRVMTGINLTDQADIAERQEMIRKCIDLKNKMHSIFQMCDKLKVDQYEVSHKTQNMEEQIERARMIEEQIIQDLVSKKKRKAPSSSSTLQSTKKSKR